MSYIQFIFFICFFTLSYDLNVEANFAHNPVFEDVSSIKFSDNFYFFLLFTLLLLQVNVEMQLDANPNVSSVKFSCTIYYCDKMIIFVYVFMISYYYYYRKTCNCNWDHPRPIQM